MALRRVSMTPFSCQAQRLRPAMCAATSTATPTRTGRHAGLIVWRSQSPRARAPRVRRARSNWRRFQRLRPACSRRCSSGMTVTGAPSQRSAVTAAVGEAVHRVAGGAGEGIRARARPPSRRTLATPSAWAQVSVTPCGEVPSAACATWKWPIGGSSGHAIGTTRSTKTPPARRPGLRRSQVTAVVREADVSWHRITLPKAPAARLRAALVGVLEEALLEDAESVHLAIAPLVAAGQTTWVAALDRAWLQDELAALQSGA